MNHFLKFCCVGTVGFGVDYAILYPLVTYADMGLFWPRAISFPIALLATWYLNRIWTFNTRDKARALSEYSRYFIVQTTGVLTNLCLYSIAISALQNLIPFALFIAFTIGAIGGLIVNFTGSKYWAFKN